MSATREPPGPSPVPNKHQIDSLTRFLSSFERQGFWFERVVHDNGSATSVEKSPEAKMFIRVLADTGWLSASPGQWRREPEKYYESSARIATADFATLQRLFSSWVERDKMLPGHLGSLWKRGDLSAALRRLQVLRAKAPDAPPPTESAADHWLDWE